MKQVIFLSDGDFIATYLYNLLRLKEKQQHNAWLTGIMGHALKCWQETETQITGEFLLYF